MNRIAFALSLLAAFACSAQALLPSKCVWQAFEHVEARGGCTSTGPLLSILPTPISPSLYAAGTLTGTKGQAVTVSRPSTKSCHNAAGAIVTLGNNTPCVEANGLLVEGSATNLFLTSTAPATQTFTTTAQSYTASFDSGSGSITYAVGTAVATGLPCTVTSSSACTFTVTTGGTVTATVSGTVVAPQFETGSFKTSYIATAGTAATRSADVVSVTVAGLSNINTVSMSATVGKFQWTASGNASFARHTLLGLGMDGNDWAHINFDADGSGNANSFGLQMYVSPTYYGSSSPYATPTAGDRFSVSNAGLVGKEYLNGVAVGTASATANSPATGAATLYLGNAYGGGSYFSGYLSNIKVDNTLTGGL